MIDQEKERYINPYTDFGFTPQDAREYEESVRIYRDLTNVVNTAERKGREEGRAEGREEGRAEGRAEGYEEANLTNARKMKALGMPNDLISQVTGLSIELLESL